MKTSNRTIIKRKTSKTMNSPSFPFNPARFTDIIKEDDYRVWTSGVALRKERAELIDWLRKKYKNKQPCQALAKKLEACKRGARCKSPACPECSTAARDLVAEVTRKFLKEKAKTATIVCVSIVPADGITNPAAPPLSLPRAPPDPSPREGLLWSRRRGLVRWRFRLVLQRAQGRPLP